MAANCRFAAGVINTTPSLRPSTATRLQRTRPLGFGKWLNGLKTALGSSRCPPVLVWRTGEGTALCREFESILPVLALPGAKEPTALQAGAATSDAKNG